MMETELLLQFTQDLYFSFNHSASPSGQDLNTIDRPETRTRTESVEPEPDQEAAI